MIQGIASFTDYFKDNSDDYIVIGGLATAMAMNDLGFIARATKDIDLVVVSKENEEFLKKLLRYIDIAGYKTKQRTNNDSRENLFRFFDSDDKTYPEQIELFAIHEASSEILKDSHIIPIDTPEYYSYLSAILLNTEYFDLLVNHTTDVDGLRIATPEVLIPLKIHAYLNLSRSESSQAKKHFNDVIRLVAMLDGESTVILKGLPREDLRDFMPELEGTNRSTVRQVLQGSGVVKEVTKDTVIRLLKSSYSDHT